MGSRKVVLVGLGGVAVGYDLKRDSRFILTHARSFALHPEFDLAGGVDPDPAKREAFQKSYNVPAYDSIAEAMRMDPGLVVISTPTPLHHTAVRDVLSSGRPRAILCEKPLAFETAYARQIVEDCKQAGAFLFVNYLRRSEPGAILVREMIAEGRLGAPVFGTVNYSGGALHTASHFFNLLESWFGPASGGRAFPGGQSAQDPECDFFAEFSGGTRIWFHPVTPVGFFHNSMELLAPQGRLRYDNGGARIGWQPVINSPVFENYRTLAEEEQRIAGDFLRIQWHVADQLARAMNGQPADICSGAAALTTLETLIQIVRLS